MSIVTDKLSEVAGTLADLKDRVWVALAGELARVVADAVRDVVHTMLRHDGPESPSRPPPAGRVWHDPVDPWADDPEPWSSVTAPTPIRTDSPSRTPGLLPDAALALAAGAVVTRWWARRTGRVAAAAGLGLAVAGLGVLGPIGRVVLAVVTAAGDLLAVPDLLQSAAGRLDRR